MRKAVVSYDGVVLSGEEYTASEVIAEILLSEGKNTFFITPQGSWKLLPSDDFEVENDF